MSFTRTLLVLSVMLACTAVTRAQVTVAGGTTAAGSYTSLSSAVTAINGTALTGPVTINVTSSYTESGTITLGSATLNASSSSTNTITINGGGNTITAWPTGTSTTTDGILKIAGTDYVTISNLNLQENVANTTPATQMEWGIAIVKQSATDGSQNISISGCTISLNKTNTASVCIYSGNHTATSTTSLTPTAASGINSNILINGNTVSNAYIPISINGYTTSTYADAGLQIGSTTGNTISNYGGGSNPAYGIFVNGQISPKIENNSVTLGTGTTTTAYGIYANSNCFTNLDINANTVSVSSSATTSQLTAIANLAGFTGTVNINNNVVQNCTYTTASSGNVYMIYENAATGTVNMNGNTVTGLSYGSAATAGSGSLYMIYKASGSATAVNANNNIVYGNTFNGTTGAIFAGIYLPAGTTQTANNNQVYNNTIPATGTGTAGTIYGIRLAGTTVTANSNQVHDNAVNKTTGTGAIYGIYDLSSPSAETYNNNTVYNLSMAGTGTVGGIYMNTAAGTRTETGNTIYSLSSGGTVYGFYNLSSSPSIFKNKIYDLSSTGAGGLVYGIYIGSGTTVNIYNNLIGDLKATTATGTGSAVNGIYLASTSSSTNINVYYNTVYLNATSTGANFSTSGIYATTSSTASTAALDMRNNVVINKSAATGTGITAAYRRSSSALTNYAATSNKNLLYAGAGGALLYDGTTSYTTMATYQAAVTPRDANSVAGETSFDYAGGSTAFFTSTTGSNASYLKPVAGITTQAESGGAAVTGITDDYNGVTRPASGINPDLGAWEFAGVTPAPSITLNSITPGAGMQCAATARAVSVNVTTASGTITGATLSYSFNGTAGSGSPVTMTNAGGSAWTGSIPAPSPANANVTWSITATNSLGISTTYTGTGYQDAPLTGTTATATVSAATICAGSNDTLTALLTVSNDTIILGSGTSTSTSSASNPFYGGYGGVKTQYIIKASELAASGFVAGPITSVGINITSAGSTLSGFAISMDTTSLSAMTGTILNTNNSVYSTASFVPANGVNTFNFTTPYTWDGVSNLVLSFCWSNNNTSNTASAVIAYSPGFTASAARYVDSRTPAEVCSYTGSTTPTGWNGGSTTSTSRPLFIFSGVKKKTIVSVVWSNGTTTVGTNNPQVVNPAVTTTYNAVVTYSGCTATTNNVVVTANPMPAAPTATNSNQCGTQIPTAAVADPNGYTTPTFKWYAASTGGTALQASTSATYTSAIAATTTFYVSVTNPATGCESNRTPVTVTVASPDTVTAKANGTAASTGSCLGSSVNLTAVKSGTTNNYTYTWTASPATGSGIATSTAGQNISVTPTAAGIYTYTVTAVDGSCTTTSTVVDTVKNPFANGAPVATASPAAICAGANDTLRVVVAGVGSAAVGAGAGTATTYDNPFYSSWSHTQQQILVKASELSASGLVAGNITGLSLQITSGTTIMPDFSLGIQNTTAASLSTLTTSGFTTVYSNATGVTPVIGTNTITFTTPYYWDGVSNILLKFCWGNSTTTAFQGSTAVADATSYVCSVNAHNTTATTGSSICGSSTVFQTYSNRPRFTFYGLAGTAPATVSWSNGSTTVGTSNPQVVNPAVNTTYTANVTVDGCSATSNGASVTIGSLGTATASVTANTICAGQNDTLTATITGVGAPFTYSWSDGAAVVGTTQTIVVSPASTKTYTVTITNACSQTANASKTITVNPIPTASITANSPVCAGSTLNLTGNTNIGTTFVWTGPNSFNAVTQSPSITNVTTAASGVYTFKVTANGCTSPVASATVVVNPAPSAATVTPSAATICAGDMQLLKATGGLVADQTIFSDNFNAATNSWTTGNTTTGGTPANAAWSLKPYPYAYNNTFTTFRSNDSSQFYISNSDSAGSGNVTNTTLQSPAFSTVGATSAYVDFYHFYDRWTAANDSATVELSSDGVNWAPARTFNADRGTATNFAHDTVSLNAYLGLPNVYVRFHYTATYGFYWAIDNVTVRGAFQLKPVWSPATNLYTNAAATTAYTGTGIDSVYAKPTATTTYTATYTSATGCTSSGTAAITVNPLPNATVSGASAVCANSSVTLTPATTGGTWTSSNTAVATVNSAGVVTGIAAGTDTIRYKVTNASGCTDSSFKVVTVNALPNAAISGSSAVCVNSTLTLTPATTGGTWISTNTALATVSSSGVVTGIAAGTDTIRYKVTNASGCTDSTFKVITVNAQPNATITGAAAICANDTTTLTGATTGGTWTSSNPAIATVSSTGLVTGVAAGTDTITYTVNNGCSATATKVITVKPLPSLTVTANGPTTFCANDSVTFTAHSGSVTYQWSDANGTITGAVDSVYTVHNSGAYTVNVTGTNGCGNTSAAQSVTVNPLPVPVITANGVDMTTGTFTTYQWNLNGNAISGATNSTYSATQNGNYTVTVTDGNGCSGTSAAYNMTKVGIDEHGGKGTIRIYPNPTKDVVYIDAPVPVNITVYSLDGRKIAYAEKAKSINLGKFAAGAYTLVITDENASFKLVQRIVKAD